jgi:hypothetical protein
MAPQYQRPPIIADVIERVPRSNERCPQPRLLRLIAIRFDLDFRPAVPSQPFLICVCFLVTV